jgi:P-type Cu+ transporter
LETHIFDEEILNGKDHSSNVPHRLTLSVGGMTCASCVIAVTQALTGLYSVHDVSVSLLGSSAVAILNDKAMVADVLEGITDIGYEADVASLQPLNMDATTVEMGRPLHVSLSVGGMTCTACSTTITRLLSEQDGVTDISVSLIGKSASLVVKSMELIPVIQDIIERAGYEASVVSMEPVKITSKAKEVARGQHTVDLHVEGMYCE